MWERLKNPETLTRIAAFCGGLALFVWGGGELKLLGIALMGWAVPWIAPYLGRLLASRKKPSSSEGSDRIKPIVLAVALFVPALTACPSSGAFQRYVEAHRDIFNIVGPAHERYVETDDELSPEQKERRLRLLEAERRMIEENLGKER